MNAIVEKGVAKGVVYAPPSKSETHRALICAALSHGQTTIENVALSDDIRATIACLEMLGASFSAVNGCCLQDGYETQKTGETAKNTLTVNVSGVGGRPQIKGVLPCNESGSTLRFLLPLALLSSRGKEITFTGTRRLFERGVGEYQRLFENSATFCLENETLRVTGSLRSGDCVLRGDISSQFISGLLFALPLLHGDSNVKILPPAESAGYIRLTVEALRRFGVQIRQTDEFDFFVGGGQSYVPTQKIRKNGLRIGGDWSNAAFFYALNTLGGAAEIRGVDEYGAQSDKICKELFRQAESGYVCANLADCPDLAPVLFAVTAAKHGGRFTGTKRLKIKECDRAEAMKEELKKFGVDVIVGENSVEIPEKSSGLPHAPNCPLFSHGDHRIAMALSVLCTQTGGKIQNAEAVKKSYPNFFDDLAALSIRVTKKQ